MASLVPIRLFVTSRFFRKQGANKAYAKQTSGIIAGGKGGRPVAPCTYFIAQITIRESQQNLWQDTRWSESPISKGDVLQLRVDGRPFASTQHKDVALQPEVRGCNMQLAKLKAHSFTARKCEIYGTTREITLILVDGFLTMLVGHQN
jgi:hypothetical protein